MLKSLVLVPVICALLGFSPPPLPPPASYEQAARHGDIEFFRKAGTPAELHQEGWPHNPQWIGDRPMVVAARHGHWDLVEWLLDHGASAEHWDSAGYMPLDYAIRSREALMIGRLARTGPLMWRRHLSVAPELWDAIYESVHRNDRELLEALLTVNIQPPPEIMMMHNPAPMMSRFDAERDQLASLHLSVASRYAMRRGHADLATLLDAVLDSEESPLGRATRLVMTEHEEDVHFMMIAARFEAADFLDEHFRHVSADVRDLAGHTALIHAARTGNAAACCWLIEGGANPSTCAENAHMAFHSSVEPSPLHYAIEMGNVAVVANLLEAGAEANLPPIRYSMLDRAVMLGHHDIAALMLEAGAELNFKAQRRHLTYTLEVAAGSAHATTMMAMLLAHSRLRDDHVASVAAALFATRTKEVVEMLLREEGVEVDTPHPRHGLNALCGAARRGQAELVRHLLARGADPRSRLDRSPLHQAIESGRPEVVQLLLEAGADPNASRAPFGTPLARTISRARPAIRGPLLPHDRAVIILLLEAGADPAHAQIDMWQNVTSLPKHSRQDDRRYCEIVDLLRDYQRP